MFLPPLLTQQASGEDGRVAPEGGGGGGLNLTLWSPVNLCSFFVVMSVADNQRE